MEWSRTEITSLSDSALRNVAVHFAETIEDFQQTIREQAEQLTARDEEVKRQKLHIEKLNHELAILKRQRFGTSSEGDHEHQYGLLDSLRDEDIGEVEADLNKLVQAVSGTMHPPRKARRQPLPPQLPRVDIRHDPESTQCDCGCELERIGADVSEKLDYVTGHFCVERHIRSKWACRSCETVVQAPVDPHVIDGGIPTTRLLAHILTAKYADHQPLYRQRQGFGREGMVLATSTLADWVGRCGFELKPLVEAWQSLLLEQPVLHADETPIGALSPGRGSTQRAYLWAYATTRYAPVQGVVYDFQPTRSGAVSRAFLSGWSGYLVCDDYSGYKAGFKGGITEVACWAHARRKFHELVESSDSPIGKQAMGYIQALYRIEGQAATEGLSAAERQRLQGQHAVPILQKLQIWLIAQRDQLVDGQQTARAIDYTLKRWEALVRYTENGELPIDNNWVENQIRPWALGRNNWLFAGSVRAGQRAANIMSLVQSAKINGLESRRYLTRVLDAMPTARRSDLPGLFPIQLK